MALRSLVEVSQGQHKALRNLIDVSQGIAIALRNLVEVTRRQRNGPAEPG